MTGIEIEGSTERKSRMTGLIWGKAKCGKTTLLTSLPGKKLFVMLDPDGENSIPNHPDIMIMRLYEQPDDVILRYLRDKLPAIIRKNEQGFNSVILDSLSTLGLIALNEAIRTEVGGSPKFKPSIDTPGLAAYGSRTNNLVDIVNKLLRATGSVGAHCWFTAHEDEAKTDDKGNILEIGLTLSGKATNGIGLNVSEIWHLNVHDKKWRLMIAPGRGRTPMGSRIFDVTKEIEFQVKFNPALGTDQPHSLAKWYQDWIDQGRTKLEVPK